jgi:hypothetical protein
MADQTFTSGQILTAAQMTTLQSNTGLVAMTPTSVSGTGVSLSGNTVSISAASTASIIGCFTSAFTNYAVVYNFTSVSNYVRFQLRTASADVATGYGATFAAITDNSTAWGWLNANAVSWNDTKWLVTNNQPSFGSLTLFNPQKATNTYLDNNGTSFTSTNSFKYLGGGRNTGTDVCTGLTLFPDSGTFTGTVNVYGYRL